MRKYIHVFKAPVSRYFAHYAGNAVSSGYGPCSERIIPNFVTNPKRFLKIVTIPLASK
ncbi:MAG: hypothetical protein LBF62_05085 [Tannerellaceae bacterium]|nr:hypothetical protein [Tannerellaceae bacterium]